MMRITTRTILLIIIVFLLGTNVAVIVTFRNHLKSEQEVEKPKIEVPDHRMGRFFREQLHLDDKQHKKFREFRQTYHRSANSLLIEMQEIRSEMMKMLKKKNSKRLKLNELANHLGEHHKDLKLLTFDYYFNMRSVLDAEQREVLIEIFQAMLTNEGYAKTPRFIPVSSKERIGDFKDHDAGVHTAADSCCEGKERQVKKKIKIKSYEQD